VLLEGRNIRLRPVTLADADAWLAGEDEQMARMFELPRRSTRDDVVAAIGNWSAMWRTGGCATGASASPPRDGGDELNVSYWVAPSWRRRGIAKEAVSLAIEYAATERRAPSVPPSSAKSRASPAASSACFGACCSDIVGR